MYPLQSLVLHYYNVNYAADITPGVLDEADTSLFSGVLKVCMHK